MRQSKVTRFLLASTVSLLLFPTTLAVAAGSSSITKTSKVPVPKVIMLTSLPVSTTAFQAKRSGRQLCKSTHCKQRQWRLHHPRPRYPSKVAPSSEYGNGDGFLGGPLACGKHYGSNGRYGANNMGVANKELPCGTKLKMCYPAVAHPRHCVHVTVVDRGPYSGDREFDLQIAPAAKLGFSGLGSVKWEVLKLG